MKPISIAHCFLLPMALGVLSTQASAVDAASPRCATEIRLGGDLCDPGRFNPVEGRFQLYAKMRRVAVKGATEANGLPVEFNAYVFDFNDDPKSGPLTPPVFHVPKLRPESGNGPPKSLGVMRFDLHNELPDVWNDTYMVNNLIPAGPQPLNLHTHGLLVQPHGADKSGHYGDFVGVLGCPKSTLASCPDEPSSIQMTEICGMAKSAAEGHACPAGHHARGHDVLLTPIPYEIEIPGDHPASLNWFHPHAHEIASPQVGAGLAGVLTIGSLCSSPALTEKSAATICEDKGDDSILKSNVRERFFLLKDLQVFARRPGGKPAKGDDIPSAEGYRVIPACNVAAGIAPKLLRAGYCQFDAPDSTAPNGTWLFTVNGQIEPTVTMQAGRPEVWRFANLSANATYKLSLCKSEPIADPTDPDLAICPDADQKFFTIISLDGGLSPGDSLTGQGEILLMPGGRAEIIVQPEAGEHFTLLQKGFHAPDLYPPAFLASVSSEAGTANAPPINFVTKQAPASTQAQSRTPRPAPSFDKPEDCETMPTGLTSTDWLSLSGKQEVVSLFFGKISDDPEILTLGLMKGNPETSSDSAVKAAITACLSHDSSAAECQTFKGTAFTMDHRNLCLKHGMTVTFRLYNLTDETHNFHIHQQKFEVSPAIDASFKTPSIAAAIGSQIQRATVSRASGSDLPGQRVVDSVPVPPVWKASVPEVTMRFDRPEQVGDFVFHCHILEHEDKGMMKRITVYTQDAR